MKGAARTASVVSRTVWLEDHAKYDRREAHLDALDTE